jgi:hypothetical protein
MPVISVLETSGNYLLLLSAKDGLASLGLRNFEHNQIEIAMA